MPVYVRVRDLSNRHEFDMPENHPHIAKGLVEVIKPKLYPPSTVMRPPKHHLNLARQSAAQDETTSPEVADTIPVTSEEN